MHFAAGAAVSGPPARHTAGPPGRDSPAVGADTTVPEGERAATRGTSATAAGQGAAPLLPLYPGSATGTSATAALAISTAGAALSLAAAGRDSRERPYAPPGTFALDAGPHSSISSAAEPLPASTLRVAPVASNQRRPVAASGPFAAPQPAARGPGRGHPAAPTWAAVCFTPPVPVARRPGQLGALQPARDAGQYAGSGAGGEADYNYDPSVQEPSSASAVPNAAQALDGEHSPVWPAPARGEHGGGEGAWDTCFDEGLDGAGPGASTCMDDRAGPGAMVRWEPSWDGIDGSLRDDSDAYGRWVPDQAGDAAAGRAGKDSRWSALDRWLTSLGDEDMSAAGMVVEAGMMVQSGGDGCAATRWVPNDAARLSLNLRIRFDSDGPLPSFAGCPSWARSFLSIHYQVPCRPGLASRGATGERGARARTPRS
jgi:hypothetical protein